jgi:Insertion element 4 transposase N-terminal/Transposase DDE domain
MSQQSNPIWTTDEAGRVLDRLAGLEKFISPELIRQALGHTGRTNRAGCRLTHDLMLWIVLAMGIFTDVPIRHVFKRARRLRKGEPTPPRSSLCEARQRLGVEPVAELFRRVVRTLASPDTPGAFFRGWRLVGFDGVLLDAPDSAANALAFHRADGGRGKGAFPQVRKVSLVELGTHAELALAIGGWQDGERDLARTLLADVPPDGLVMLDRGFFSYDFWQEVTATGVAVIGRVKAGLVLRPIQYLYDGSYLAKIYPNHGCRNRDERGILVRVIDYELDDPMRTGHGERHRQITSVLQPEWLPAMEWVCAYHERWEAELVYDEQKTHQDPVRPGKPAHLRSETPEGVRQEVWAISLGHFVTRALMAEAAAEQGLDPDRLSFVGALRILRDRLPECSGSHGEDLARWCEALLWEVGQERIPPRRNRVNPRVVKRKMSKFMKKRPHHRGQPPLTKTFPETVVIT